MDTEASLELKTIYAPIEGEMLQLGRVLGKEFQSSEPFIGQLLQHVAKFRGKQIRPALLFLAGRVAGKEPTADHVKIGAVIELIHTATLVHDDILDDARLRRNLDTVHRRWGERAAVLLGDYIYSRAFHLSTQVPGMARLLSDTTHTICEGELLQIAHRFRPIEESLYLEIIRRKTAVLYAVSCQIGGALSGLDEAACARFHEFGLHLGMAFQIADDCLDYAGKEAVTGKSLGSDLRQGKMTLPLIYLLDSLCADDADRLRRALRGPLTPESEGWIHEKILEHGVLTEAAVRADGFVQAGKSTLAEILGGCETPVPVRESLDLVADYMVRRQK